MARQSNEQRKKGYEEAGFTVKDIPTQESPYNTWLDPDNKVNKTLNLRGVNWCSDWPSGLTMLPPLVETGATYNTGNFSENEIDEMMAEVTDLPAGRAGRTRGATIDKKVLTDYLPIIPTAFRNDLYMFGEQIGNPMGDPFGAPYYKGIFVNQ